MIFEFYCFLIILQFSMSPLISFQSNSYPFCEFPYLSIILYYIFNIIFYVHTYVIFRLCIIGSCFNPYPTFIYILFTYENLPLRCSRHIPCYPHQCRSVGLKFKLMMSAKSFYSINQFALYIES